MHVRSIALAVVMTLLGPSLAAAVCGWTCAGEHHAQAAADTCHEQGEQHGGPVLAPGQECHDVAGTPVLVRPASAPEWGIDVATSVVAVDATADDRMRAAPPRRLSAAPPGPSRVLPPLRI